MNTTSTRHYSYPQSRARTLCGCEPRPGEYIAFTWDSVTCENCLEMHRFEQELLAPGPRPQFSRATRAMACVGFLYVMASVLEVILFT